MWPVLPVNPLSKSGHKRPVFTPVLGVSKRRKREDYGRVAGYKRGRPGEWETDADQSGKMARAAPPARLRRRFKRRSRRYGRRRFRRASLSNTVPPTKLVKFKAVCRGYITGATGAIAVQTFEANSLADPTGTIGAGLPLGLDQWASFYNRYTVVGSKIDVDVHQTTDLGAGVVILNLREPSTALTNIEHYAESPHTVKRIMTSDIDRDRLTMNYSMKKFYRVNKVLDAEDQAATLNDGAPTTPNRMCYYHLACQDCSGTQSVTVEFVATITYVVLLHSRKELARSVV